MGKEIVYCDICGAQIVGDEFAKGRAVTVLNRHFCSKCRTQAPAPAPTPTPAHGTPAARATPRPATSRHLTPAPKTRTPQPKPRTTKVAQTPAREGIPKGVWIAVGVGGGVLLLALLIFLAIPKDHEPTPNPSPTNGTNGPPAPGPSPEQAAQEFVEALKRELAGITGFEEKLARIGQKRLEMSSHAGWSSTRAYQSLEELESQVRQAQTHEGRMARAREIIEQLRQTIDADRKNLAHLDAIAAAETELQGLGEEGRPHIAGLPSFRTLVIDAARQALRDKVPSLRQDIPRLVRDDLADMAQERVQSFEDNLAEFERRAGENVQDLHDTVSELRRLIEQAPRNPPDETPDEPEPEATDRTEEPPLNDWYPLLSDPLERIWSRPRDANFDAWRIEEGVLHGRRTTPGNDPREFLRTRWEQFAEVEIEFELKLEGLGIVVYLPGGTPIQFLDNRTEWTPARLTLQDGRFTGTVGERQISDRAEAGTGPIQLALGGNTHIQIRGLRVKRLR